MCEAYTSAENLLDSSVLELASFALLVRTHGVLVNVHLGAQASGRRMAFGDELAKRLRDGWGLVKQPLATAFKATADGSGSPPQLEDLCEVLSTLSDKVVTRFADAWAARSQATMAHSPSLSDRFR